MKNFCSFLFFLLGTSLSAQNIVVKGTNYPPEIDGFVEEVWDAATPITIARNFRDEKPTVTAPGKLL